MDFAFFKMAGKDPSVMAEEKIHSHMYFFSLKSTPVMNAFSTLLHAVTYGTLECSVKHTPGKNHPYRFHVFWFKDQIRKALPELLRFYLTVDSLDGVRLEESPILRLLGCGAGIRGINKLLAGFDLRPEPADSRLKIWVQLESQPLLLDFLLKESGLHKKCADPLIRDHDDFLFGCDFFFDGRIEYKLYAAYHDLTRQDFTERLKKRFSDRVMAYVALCSGVYICYRTGRDDLSLHFEKINELDRFIGQTGYLPLKQLFTTLQTEVRGYTHYKNNSGCITLQEREIETGEIRRFNLYY